jgi:hypothetical protein
VSAGGGDVRAIRCPVCRIVIAETDRGGSVRVRRGGRVVAIDPRVIPCRRLDCGGYVELERPAALDLAVGASARG